MANLNIGGNVSAGRDVNIAQEGSSITNTYNDTIQKELDKYTELTDTVKELESQLTAILTSNQQALTQETQMTEEAPTFKESVFSNLKKVGTKSLELATSIVGKVLQDTIQKYV